MRLLDLLGGVLLKISSVCSSNGWNVLFYHGDFFLASLPSLALFSLFNHTLTLCAPHYLLISCYYYNRLYPILPSLHLSWTIMYQCTHIPLSSWLHFFLLYKRICWTFCFLSLRCIRKVILESYWEKKKEKSLIPSFIPTLACHSMRSEARNYFFFFSFSKKTLIQIHFGLCEQLFWFCIFLIPFLKTFPLIFLAWFWFLTAQKK